MTLEERIKRYVEGRRPAALVIDVGWVNGLAAIRSLGRAGVPVLALDHRAGALGFRSRYALPVRTPDPAEDEEAFTSISCARSAPRSSNRHRSLPRTTSP